MRVVEGILVSTIKSQLLISLIKSQTSLVKEYLPDGSKKAAVNMYSGHLITYAFKDLRQLKDFCSMLTQNQCLCLGGLNGRFEADITTEKQKHLYPNVITRSKKYIFWMQDIHPEYSSVLFFDYDFDTDMPEHLKAYTFEQLRELLIKMIPALVLVQMLIRWSSSSNIKKEDGTPLNDKRSMHVYILANSVTEANMERFKEYLMRSLWANNLAYCKLDKGSKVLQRAFIDLSVLSPERIIISAIPMLPAGWYKDAQTEFAFYDGDALDLVDIDYSHLPDWHPVYWDAKNSLEQTVDPNKIIGNYAPVSKREAQVARLPQGTLANKLKNIKNKLNDKGDEYGVREMMSDVDADVVRYLLESIGYSIDTNYKFKIRDEKTASVSIRTDGFIKDFGGDFSGNMINFLNEVCGLSRKNSLKYLHIALGGTKKRLKPTDYEPLIDPKEINKNITKESLDEQFIFTF